MRNNLRKFREEQGLSQHQLTIKSGVPQNMISNIETGKIYPYAGWRKKLAEALGFDEMELFPGEVKADENRETFV